jgi:hypothetical protein
VSHLLIRLGFVLRPLSRTRFLIANANPVCSCVYICKFQFRPIHPPSRRLSAAAATVATASAVRANGASATAYGSPASHHGANGPGNGVPVSSRLRPRRHLPFHGEGPHAPVAPLRHDTLGATREAPCDPGHHPGQRGLRPEPSARVGGPRRALVPVVPAAVVERRVH